MVKKYKVIYKNGNLMAYLIPVFDTKEEAFDFVVNEIEKYQIQDKINNFSIAEVFLIEKE